MSTYGYEANCGGNSTASDSCHNGRILRSLGLKCTFAMRIFMTSIKLLSSINTNRIINSHFKQRVAILHPRFILSSVQLFILLFLISGCVPSSKVKDSPFCEADEVSEKCTFLVGYTPISLHSTHPAMPEEQHITLSVKGLNPVEVSSAQLSGVNMYMGNIPLQFERVNENHWQAFVRLGVCASPQMIWRLHILFSQPTEQQLEVEFSATGQHE